MASSKGEFVQMGVGSWGPLPPNSAPRPRKIWKGRGPEIEPQTASSKGEFAQMGVGQGVPYPLPNSAPRDGCIGGRGRHREWSDRKKTLLTA